VYYGLVFLADPQAMMASLSVSALNPAGITEMRAFHGGLIIHAKRHFLPGDV
jgi:hypothetical protein